MLKKVLRIIFLYIPLGFIGFSFSLVILYKWVPVKLTPLMVVRYVQNIGNDDYSFHRKWVDLEDVSKVMVRAILASEDGRFMQHSGFDFEEIAKMKREYERKGKKFRGCSTVSQQVAKNCFTFGTRTWVRKGFEAYYTVLIEFLWGKERIMEVYLNVAETGNGVFGVEAAAKKFFGTTAKRLSTEQAVSIATVLPNPLRRNAARVSSTHQTRYSIIYNTTMITPYPFKKK